MKFGISYREHTLFLPYWIYSYSLSLYTPPVYQFILTVTSQIILHLSALWNPRRSQKEKKKRKEKTKGGKKRKKTFGKNKQTKKQPKESTLGSVSECVGQEFMRTSLWDFKARETRNRRTAHLLSYGLLQNAMSSVSGNKRH